MVKFTIKPKKEIKEKEMMKNEKENERTKDKEKYDCSYFYTYQLFDYDDHLVKGIEEVMLKENAKFYVLTLCF